MRSEVVLTFGLALTLLAEKASTFSPAGTVVGDPGGNGGAAGTTAALVLTDLSVKESRFQPVAVGARRHGGTWHALLQIDRNEYNVGEVA